MSSEASGQQWLALMILGLSISILGLTMESRFIAILGVGWTFIVYFANFWERRIG